MHGSVPCRSEGQPLRSLHFTVVATCAEFAARSGSAGSSRGAARQGLACPLTRSPKAGQMGELPWLKVGRFVAAAYRRRTVSPEVLWPVRTIRSLPIVAIFGGAIMAFDGQWLMPQVICSSFRA